MTQPQEPTMPTPDETAATIHDMLYGIIRHPDDAQFLESPNGTPEVPTVESREEAERIAQYVRRLTIARDAELEPIEAEIDRLTELFHDRDGIHAHRIQRQTDSLQSWHRANQSDLPKTVRFPHGTSILRKKSVIVTNTPEFVDWAQAERPDLLDMKANAKKVRDECADLITVRLDEPGIQPAVTNDGELLPGVTLQRSEPSWRFQAADTDTLIT